MRRHPVGSLVGGVTWVGGIVAGLLVSEANSDLDVLAGVIIVGSFVLGLVLFGVAERYARNHWY